MNIIRNLPTKLFVAPLAALAVCAAFALPVRAQAPAQAPPATTASSSPKPVVVELFTSEGCSDCPPAESIAVKMEQQPLAGVDLIVIEEHVTYWNQYGWFDPFSSADWTTRQEEYVGKLPKPQPYTPEMVIDGEAQFPGSDMQKAQDAVNTAMNSPETQVTITQDKSDAKEGDFKISVGKLEGSDPGDTPEVWVAVTEDGLHSSVNAGENAGHTLYHAAVLRYLHKIGTAQGSGDAAFTGDARVKFNSKWNAKDLNIVAFVQDKKSLKIVGATQIKLGS
jgi:hypothetical protein